MKPQIRFGVNIMISIVRMILLTVTNLSRLVNIFLMVIFICGTRNILYHTPKSLVCRLQGNFRKYLNRICRAFIGLCLNDQVRQNINSQQRYFRAANYSVYICFLQRSKNREKIYQTTIVMTVHKITSGMTRIMTLTVNQINEVLRSCFRLYMS